MRIGCYEGVAMPMTVKGQRVMAEMKDTYGPEKAKRVFYASANKGTVKGVHKVKRGSLLHGEKRG